MTFLDNTTSSTQAVASQYEGFRDYQSHFLLALALVVVLYGFLRNDDAKKLPIINPKGWFQLTASQSIMSFALAGRELLEEARRRFGATPFRVLTDQGNFIMLLPQHGEEIRNDPRFSVDEPIIEVSYKTLIPRRHHYHYSGCINVSGDEVSSRIADNIPRAAVPGEVSWI